MRAYADAKAFRKALEDRLKTMAVASKADLQGLRRMVSFDRLLARVFAAAETPWLLKGGYAMELRVARARTTQDLDLTLSGPGGSGDILERLRASVRAELGDFFVFRVGEAQHALQGPPEGGGRYPVVALVAEREFTRFHVDVGLGDVLLPPAERLVGRNWLGFAGLGAPEFRAISKAQQYAEKVHAYTKPREFPNSRVKDLVDLILLQRSEGMDPAGLQKALQATFAQRGSHALPAGLPEPPASWARPFTELARECALELEVREAWRQASEYYAGLGKTLESPRPPASVASGRELLERWVEQGPSREKGAERGPEPESGLDVGR